MSLEEIWDAAAELAATVNGIKAAHSAKASADPGDIETWPEDIADGPVALVDYAGTRIDHGSLEKLIHSFDIELWTPSPIGQRAAAVKALAPLLPRVLTVFCANTRLGQGGAVIGTITETSGLDDDTLNDKPYLVQSLRLEVLEAISITHAGGP